jgi:hypothetical protein
MWGCVWHDCILIESVNCDRTIHVILDWFKSAAACCIEERCVEIWRAHIPTLNSTQFYFSISSIRIRQNSFSLKSSNSDQQIINGDFRTKSSLFSLPLSLWNTIGICLYRHGEQRRGVVFYSDRLPVQYGFLMFIAVNWNAISWFLSKSDHSRSSRMLPSILGMAIYEHCLCPLSGSFLLHYKYLWNQSLHHMKALYFSLSNDIQNPGQSSVIGFCGSQPKTTDFRDPNSVNIPLSKNDVIRYFHTNTHSRTDARVDNRKR